MPLFWLRRPHVPLLVLLLGLLALHPLVERSAAGRWTFNLIVVVGVVFSLQRIRAGRSGIRLAAALGAVALLAQAARWLGPWSDLGLVSALAQAGFYLTAAVLQVRYILRDTHATVDELYSAAVAFLLLALAWASAYWSIEFLSPGSFAVTHPSAGRPTWYELFYFSVTTLSTTGFGDVLPVSSAARAATILEQLTGVLYVALVISRLAGFAGRKREGAAG